VDFCGRLDIGGSAALVAHSRTVLSHDTGFMHVAAAFGKRIVSLWGNTVPEFGMSPYLAGEGSCFAEIKGLGCRPCSKIGFERCPKKHFRCMNLLDEDKIADDLRRLYE
jgi:ADP-heptose:LPS heptosyltransferase